MNNIYKIPVVLLFFLAVLFAQAQDNPTSALDSIPPLPYNFNANQNGGLFLDSSTTEVIYDAKTGKYIFLEKIGDYYVKRPIYMTAKEYEEYRLRRDMIDYYKSKTSAIDGKKKGSDEAKKDLLPKYYINSKFFESLFGSNEIEVNAQGNVLVKMGVLYQKTENPRLSENQRSTTTFDFDQQISASINAKVGTRLGVNINYDTQSTFDFQNLVKLEYTPTEDDILQKIEIGNVSMPLQSSLIKGAQNLFGAKVKLQFGGTEITMVGAKQQSQTRSVAAQGGATIHEFELRASDYDKDRHFFLSQRFRKDYDKALERFPLINSSINITRVEIWVTNRNNQTENVRNIVAIADLGERDSNLVTNSSVSGFTGQDPSNEANSLNNLLTSNGVIRDSNTITSAFTTFGLSGFSQGSDYTTLNNARKLELNRDFTLQPQLGFISLNRALAESEILAVAFEYTENGEVYTVGELSDNGIIAPANLVLKLLRPEIISTTSHMWNLMMKNVYDLRSFQMNPDGFRLEILYQDNTTGVPLNTLQNAETLNINNLPLLNLLQVDRLDSSNNAEVGGDGFFDYVEGITVNSQKGLVFFPKVEPFGGYLDGISGSGLLTNPNDEAYIFRELYNRTQSDAQNNFQSKDKYLLKGYYKSEGQNGIPLGAFNVPRGSVVVTTGGRNLVEGVDYVVDYKIGNVQIINPSLISSNAPIQVSVETNNAFSTQSRTFYGIDVQHKFSDRFSIGGTFLNLNEKPFTQKAQFGAEPVNNSIAGINLTYTTEVPKLTKWINHLPNIDTDAPSNFSIRAEAAYLLPNSPSGIELNGEAASYLDDFESTQIPLNIDSPSQWKLASMPSNQPALNFLDTNETITNFQYGNRRARFSWYTIDRLFYGTSLRPNSVDDDELSRAETRRISYGELFPEQDIDISQSNIVQTLDLAYYPEERGTYNYETDNVDSNTGKFTEPENNWGGIMRALTTTDFQQANVEYIQFWMMDPYENYSMTTDEGAPNSVNSNDFDGELYFNLGNISEDILHDDRKMFENGLPADGNLTVDNVDETDYSVIPTVQALLNAFTENDSERPNQDLGLDGRNDDSERTKLTNLFGSLPAVLNSNDPSNDNYEYFRSTHLDNINASILTRYKNYNRTQGNSPTLNNSTESYPTTGTQFPDTEDLNRDQTMSTAEAYFQYKIQIKKENSSEMQIGRNYIIDRVKKTQTLPNGSSKDFIWYQFRIPIQTINNLDPNQAAISVGNISSFNSIRFMRMFLTKFKIPVVLRVAKLELVRGNWRRYTKYLKEPLITDPAFENLPVTQNQNFEVGVVNLFANKPKYQMPPGVEQERLRGNTSVQRQNEQSISIKVKGLPSKETRAVYKNTTFDMRMFKKFKLFVHLEKRTLSDNLADGDLSAIIRLGSDIKDNYYQIEVPLLISDFETTDREELWKNSVEAALEEFGKLRLERDKLIRDNILTEAQNVLYPTLTNGGMDGKDFGAFKLYVKGNPTLSKVKTMMLGVKNNSGALQSAELWFNEMRVVDFDNEGGWAAVANANLNLADFADVAVSGGMSTKGFGSLDQRVGERSQQDVMQYDFVSNINLGQLLPKNYGIKLPLNVSISEELKNPKYDPQYQDVLFENTTSESSPNRDNASDYTKRRSISLINVRKERTNLKKKKRLYDVENLSVSFAYNDSHHHDYNIEKANDKNVRASAGYNFSFKPKSYEPFKKSKFVKGKKYLKFIKDFNINYLPTSFSVNSNINRTYNEFLSRPLVESNILPDLPTLERRDYAFDWDYNIAYDLTKSLQFNFRAANSYINDYFDKNDQNEVINGQIFNKFFSMGRPEHYHQKLDATYKLPLDKIPGLNFIKGTYSYVADFDWQAASRDNVALVGNKIQNANTHNLNADLDMKKLYRTLGVNNIFVKKNKSAKARAKAKKKKEKKERKAKEKAEKKKGKSKENSKQDSDINLAKKDNKVENNKAKESNKLKRSRNSRGGKLNRKNLPFGKKAVLALVDVITSVKKIKISYTENNGTELPGYKHSVGFLGRDSYTGGIAPTFGFVFGEQGGILSRALNEDWIVTRGGTDLNLYPYYNKTYSRTHYDKLDINLKVKPFKNFTIDVVGNRTYTKNISQQIDVIDDGTSRYMENSPVSEIGNYAISHVMIGTAFTNSDKLFDSFLNNRDIIKQRLVDENLGTNLSGYGDNNQDVLLPAFIATYSGENLNKTNLNPFRNIPLPNWRVSYKGLSKIKWFKKRFRTVTLEHNYQSGYSITGYTRNLKYDPSNPLQTDFGGYVNKTLFTGVNLVEAFSPLIKLDVKMKNSFSFRGEIKTDRSLNLNFSNSSITEIKGKEYVIGLGYKLKNVKWEMRLGESKKIFKGDISFKADFGIRNNITNIRSFETKSNQITGGQTIMTIKFTADYNLNKNIMASFFYDQNSSKFAISTAFPRNSINTGISIRYNIGN